MAIPAQEEAAQVHRYPTVRNVLMREIALMMAIHVLMLPVTQECVNIQTTPHHALTAMPVMVTRFVAEDHVKPVLRRIVMTAMNVRVTHVVLLPDVQTRTTPHLVLTAMLVMVMRFVTTVHVNPAHRWFVMMVMNVPMIRVIQLPDV